MARDSSPLSKRLKALAVRAGLPIESGQTGGAPSPAPVASAAAAPDDEQPTGEFPAVAASDTPEEDRPTGEFPVVDPTGPDSTPEPQARPAAEAAPASAEASPAASDLAGTAFVGAVPPPPRGDDPAPTPAEEPMRPTVPPIWTDSPAESQSPLTAAQADGPTLAPPTLTSLPGPDTTEPDPSVGADAPAEDATGDEVPEPATPLHEVVPDERADDHQADAPTSRATELDEALSLEPSPADEAENPPSDESSEPSHDEQETIAADALNAKSLPGASTTDAAADAAAAASTTAADEPPAPDPESDSAPDEPEPAAPASADKLSLTGRIAAIRRRIRPDTPPTGADATSLDSAAQTATPAPTAEDEPPPPVTVVEPTPSADAHADEPFAKPTFSERAALRRRVKTLRARRDAGLLEIGAITIDQRRFGDPTAGTLLRRRTDELVDLDNEIAAIEYALEEHASATAIAALGTVRCLGCGTLVGPADRYCAHCGTPRPTDTPSTEVHADRGT